MPKQIFATPSLQEKLATAWTVGVISRHLDVPVHRIAYLIRTRRIAPCYRAGVAFVFDKDAVRTIEEQLRRMASKKRHSELAVADERYLASAEI